MLSIESGGSTKRTESFLASIIRGDLYSRIDSVCQAGVLALAAATPVESGATAAGWSYEIINTGNSVTIWWKNTNVVDGFNVAVGLQYGHGTGTGGWVEGYDYINPALKPIFDKIAEQVWKEVQKG